MLINVLNLCNTTFAPQTHPEDKNIHPNSVSFNNQSAEGPKHNQARPRYAEFSGIWQLWQQFMQHLDLCIRIQHTKSHTQKKAFSTGLFKKEWQGVEASYKCAIGNCILFKICCITCQEDDKKVEAHQSKGGGMQGRRSRRCRRLCGRHRFSPVNSSKDKVTHHKRDPGGLEADICGEVDGKVHLISTNLTVLSALPLRSINPPAISATLKGVRCI